MDRLGTTSAPVASARFAATATCGVDDEIEARLGQIENGQPVAPPADSDTGTNTDGDTNDAAPEADVDEPTTDEVVKAKVTLLMDTVVSPEKPIRIDPPEHPVDAKVIQSSIKSFELRDGPADVTSYHDFNSLQIAFRHVWTEVFDTELEALGKELYQEFVKLKDFSGLDNGKDDPITHCRGSRQAYRGRQGVEQADARASSLEARVPGEWLGHRSSRGPKRPTRRPSLPGADGQLHRQRCRAGGVQPAWLRRRPPRQHLRGHAADHVGVPRERASSPAASTRSRRRSRRTP